jgi:hypothetical protein
MRQFKGLVFLAACAAVAALVFVARARPRDLTDIDRIHPAMNYAYVRVSGAVVGQPTLTDDSLSFVLDDASGRIRVSAYRRVVHDLQRDDRLPAPGDHVMLEGTLRIREGDASILLGAASSLRRERPEPLDVELAALDALAEGERATTVGQLRRVRRVADQLVILTLRHDSAVVEVPLSRDVLPDPAALRVGDWMRVTGGVARFREAVQLLPAAPDDLAADDPLPPDVRPIRALDANLLGAWVTVRGAVSDFKPFDGGMRLELRDADGRAVDVVAFDSAWQSVPFSETLGLGDELQVFGALAEFRGRLEVMPELAADLHAEDFAAVDGNRRAGDPLHLRIAQRAHGHGHVFGRGQPAARVAPHRRADDQVLRRDFAQRVGVGYADEQGVDDDAVRGELERQRARVRFERGLRRADGTVVLHHLLAAGAAHAEHAAAAHEEVAAPQILRPVDEAVGHHVHRHLELRA